ncbi:MAG: hypothetical protein IKE21_06970 [Erysipelotrichaceae bacterium]|nr:hypothetical protein [Erysipelotrichaceae bacterium]
MNTPVFTLPEIILLCTLAMSCGILFSLFVAVNVANPGISLNEAVKEMVGFLSYLWRKGR